MSKYTATITVDAEFMTSTEAEKRTGHVYGVTGEEQGYLVSYEDGNIEFMPKEVFEKHFRSSETFLDRLYIERSELEKKLKKLDAFLSTDAESKLQPKDVELLKFQSNAMHRYLNVLNKRINRATTK